MLVPCCVCDEARVMSLFSFCFLYGNVALLLGGVVAAWRGMRLFVRRDTLGGFVFILILVFSRRKPSIKEC